MNCADYRAGMSARLDGEPVAAPDSAVNESDAHRRLDEHSAECADCRQWLAAAERLKAATKAAVGPSPAWTERLVAGLSGLTGGEQHGRGDHFSGGHGRS